MASFAGDTAVSVRKMRQFIDHDFDARFLAGFALQSHSYGLLSTLCANTSSTPARNSSATLQAWAMQPRGVNGGSASKISALLATLLSVHMAQCGDEGIDQSAPHNALVVGAVALPRVALVVCAVGRILRRQTAQAAGS